MKGFKPSRNKGVSGARKKQKAAGDHSVKRVKQSKGAPAKAGSMAFAGNKTIGLGDKRPVRDNIGGVIKAPSKGDM
jgi:hypothetical protein